MMSLVTLMLLFQQMPMGSTYVPHAAPHSTFAPIVLSSRSPILLIPNHPVVLE